MNMPLPRSVLALTMQPEQGAEYDFDVSNAEEKVRPSSHHADLQTTGADTSYHPFRTALRAAHSFQSVEAITSSCEHNLDPLKRFAV